MKIKLLLECEIAGDYFQSDEMTLFNELLLCLPGIIIIEQDRCDIAISSITLDAVELDEPSASSIQLEQ